MPDMRFAPPQALRVADRGGGMNSTSVKSYNERLIVSLIRKHGQLSRLELGRLSGLSAQTISVIVRSLERDRLVIAGEVQRGRTGPPTVPMTLNAEGGFAIGITVGRKSTDLVLVDFAGTVRQTRPLSYDTPQPDAIIEHIRAAVSEIEGLLTVEQRSRVSGVGVVLPDDFEEWSKEIGPQWAGVDFEALGAEMLGKPAYTHNDVTGAAGAELLFGAARMLEDFAYFFVGATTNSRVILNHHIYAGNRPTLSGALRPPLANLQLLSSQLDVASIDTAAMWHGAEDWTGFKPELDRWLSEAAVDLAAAIVALRGFVEVKIVLIDGRFPRAVRERLVAEVRVALNAAYDDQKLDIQVIAGQFGADAKAVGAASLPLLSRFMIENVGLAGREPGAT